MAADETWEVKLYETPEGRTPVLDFLKVLPPKHRAKVRQAIGRLELFGPRLGFPDTSDVKNAPFRELRARFAGQQYRMLYLQEGDTFVLFAGFHKRGDRDLSQAVREAEKRLADFRSERPK